MILIYDRRYFKNLENDLTKKSQGQSIDFDQTLTFYKIIEEKGDKILRKLYIKKLERKRKILI